MAEDIDPRLQDIVERMFQRCAQDEEYEQAIGIALESRRLDIVKAMVEKGDSAKLLPYVLEVSMTLVQQLEFRNQVKRRLLMLAFWLTDRFGVGPSTLGGIVSKLARTWLYLYQPMSCALEWLPICCQTFEGADRKEGRGKSPPPIDTELSHQVPCVL